MASFAYSAPELQWEPGAALAIPMGTWLARILSSRRPRMTVRVAWQQSVENGLASNRSERARDDKSAHCVRHLLLPRRPQRASLPRHYVQLSSAASNVICHCAKKGVQ